MEFGFSAAEQAFADEVRAFLRHFDLASVHASLPAVAAWKCDDRNMRPGEIAAIQRVAAAQAHAC